MLALLGSRLLVFCGLRFELVGLTLSGLFVHTQFAKLLSKCLNSVSKRVDPVAHPVVADLRWCVDGGSQFVAALLKFGKSRSGLVDLVCELCPLLCGRLDALSERRELFLQLRELLTALGLFFEHCLSVFEGDPGLLTVIFVPRPVGGKLV